MTLTIKISKLAIFYLAAGTAGWAIAQQGMKIFELYQILETENA